MTKEEKAIATEKKIECIIGILLLLPPLLSIFCFTFSWFDWFQSDGMTDFCRMYNLNGIWDYGEGATSTIYLGLMAIAGAYLIKNNIHYFLLKNKKEEKKPTNSTEDAK